MSIAEALSILTGGVVSQELTSDPAPLEVSSPTMKDSSSSVLEEVSPSTTQTDPPSAPKQQTGVATALSILSGSPVQQKPKSPTNPFENSNYLEMPEKVITPLSKEEYQTEQANREAVKGSFLPVMTGIGRAQVEYGKTLQRTPEQDEQYQERYTAGESVARARGIDEKKVRYQGTNPVITPEMKKGLSQPDIESLFTYLTEQKRSSQVKTGKEIETAGKSVLKIRELFDPYIEANLQDDIVKIQTEKPSIVNSLRTGNVQGAADEFVFDAFMSGNDVAIQKAVTLRDQLGAVAAENQQRVKDEKTFGKELILSTAQMLPMMAKGAYYGAIPVVGPALSTSMWARQGAGEVLADMEKEGVPRDVAMAVALNAGLAYSLIESMQVGQIKNIEPIKKAINAPLKKKMLHLAKAKGWDWVKENLEEINQSIVQVAAVDVAKQKAGMKIDSVGLVKKYRDAVKETFKQSAGPMGLLSLLGFGAGAVKTSYQHGKESAAPSTKAPTATEILTGTATEKGVENIPVLFKEAKSPEKQQSAAEKPNKNIPRSIPENIPASGKTLKDFSVKDEEFWTLPDEKRNEIFSQLPETEQERLNTIGNNERDVDIEAVRKRIAEVEREDNEKEEIQNVELEPTDGQKSAGNYRKGHIRKEGLNITIENPAQSVRKGTNPEGKPWETVVNHDYGYILGTKGADGYRNPESGDQVDVFINPGVDTSDKKVYVVDQVDPETGAFDEHKVMMGFESADDAQKAYLSNYEKGWKGLDAVTEMELPVFKEWVFSEATKEPAKNFVQPQKTLSSESGVIADGKEKLQTKTEVKPVEDARSIKEPEFEGGRTTIRGELGAASSSVEEDTYLVERMDDFLVKRPNSTGETGRQVYDSVRKAIKEKDIQTLYYRMTNFKDSDGSRIAFQGITGKSVPSSIEGTEKALSEYFGKDVIAAAKNNVLAAAAPQIDASRFKSQEKFHEKINDLIERGYTDIRPSKKSTGSAPAYRLYNIKKRRVVEVTNTTAEQLQYLTSAYSNVNNKKSVEKGSKEQYIRGNTQPLSGASNGTDRPQQESQSQADTRTDEPVFSGDRLGRGSGGTGQRSTGTPGTSRSTPSVNKTGKKLSDFNLTTEKYWKLNKTNRNAVFVQLTENEQLSVNAQKPLRKAAGPATYAKLKKRLPTESYNSSYLYQELIHGIRVDFVNAMKFGYKTADGTTIGGAQQNYMQDIAIVTGQRSIFKNLPKRPSDNALRYLQSVVDAYSTEEAQAMMLEKTGVEAPTHTDDVISFIQEAKTKSEFTSYHRQYEASASNGTTGSDASDSEYLAAEKVFNENPDSLTDRQREILETEWGMNLGDAIAAMGQQSESEDVPFFAKSRDINQMRMDLFDGGSAEQQQELDLFQQIAPKQGGSGAQKFSNESGDLFSGTQYGDTRSKTEKEIARIQKENEEKTSRNYKGTSGLPLFDKNIQEAMATDQINLFGGEDPVFAKGAQVNGWNQTETDHALSVPGLGSNLNLPVATDERSKRTENRLSAAFHRFSGIGFDEENPRLRVLSPSTLESTNITNVLQNLTKKDVVWFETDASLESDMGFIADGVSFPRGVSPELTNKVFINVNSSRPALWVAGHELWHFLEKNKEFNDQFWNVVRVTAKGRALLSSMAKDYQAAARSEFAADIVGEMLTDPEFWEVLEKQNANLFDKIIRKIIEVLSRLSNSLKAAFAGTTATPEYTTLIENVDDVRQTLARILTSYHKSAKSGEGVDAVSDSAVAVMSMAGPKRDVAPVDIFYSPLLKAVRGLKQEKGTGEQFFNMLTKTPGVKEAEWKWMGLDDFLKGKKSVTRGEIEEFVRGNEVRVEEKSKNDSSNNTSINNATKYSSYVLPEAENYREVLMALPPQPPKRSTGKKFASIEEARIWYDTFNETPGAFDSDTEYGDISFQNNEIIHNKANMNLPDYKSSHWDEPNVFAHARLDDRTGLDGKKILFVEEIQSDWEREAREKGVAPENPPVEDAREYYGIPNESWNAMSAQQREAYLDEMLQSSGGKTKRVPNQPFLKNWQEVVLKRILRMAAEEGYDRVAWINGQQTADRYDLSHYVERVVVEKFKDRADVYVYDKNDKKVFQETGLPIAEERGQARLREIVGKDLTEKIVADYPHLTGRQQKVYTGVDLKIGGEWAFNLYDKMIPQFLNKYGKKWGAQVEGAQIEGVGEQLSIKVTPAMKDAVLYEGQPLFARSRKKSPLKSKEELQKAKEEFLAEKERVEAIEREVRQMRGRLLSMPEHMLLERAEINVKVKSNKLDELDQIKNLILNYAKKIGIDGIGYNKVASWVASAKGVLGLEKAIKVMDQVWEGARRVEAIEALEKTLEREYRRLNKIASGKLKSTVAPEYNITLRRYLDELTSNPDVKPSDGSEQFDYKGWVDKMLTYYNTYAQKDVKQAESLKDLPIEIVEWMEDPSKPVPEKISKAIKYLFKHTISTMTTDEIKKTLADIESLKATGRTVKMAEDFARELELNQRAEAGAQVIKEATKEPSSSEETFLQAAKKNKLTKWEWAGKLAEKGLWSLIDAERMTEWLSGFKNVEVLKNSILQPLYSAEKKKQENTKAAHSSFEKMYKGMDMKKLYQEKLVEIDFKQLYDASGMEYKGKNSKISLTINQAMFVYANSQNPGNRAHLIGMFGTEAVADQVINTVVTALPAEYKQAVDAQIDYYDNVQYYRMNPVFLEEHEVPLPKEQRYFPIQAVKTDRAESAVVADYLARYSSRFAGVQKGMTKMRVHSQAPFRQMDYLGTVVRNILQTEHYIAYNGAVRDVQRFLNHKEVRAAIEDKNEEVYSQLKDWLKAVAYGKVGGSENILDKVTDFMRGNFSTFALGLRLTTSLQQFASLPRGMAYLDKKSTLMKSSALFMKNPKAALEFASKKSGLMASRETSYERELAESYEKGSIKKFAGLQNSVGRLKEWSMWHIGLTDRVVATVLWNARYQEGLDKGLTDAESVSIADELIRKTQSRGGVLYMPAIYRGSGLSRAFLMFSSDLNQSANLLFELAGKWNIQPTTENLTQMALFFMVPTMVIYIVNNALRLDEPEDYVSEFVHQFTGAVPFLGLIIDASIKALMDDVKAARGVIPDKTWTNYVAELSPAPLQTFETLSEGMAKRNPEKLVTAGAQLFGIPYSAPKQYVQGASKFLSGEVPNWRSLIWGKRKALPKTVYSSMAQRFHKPRPKSDDTDVYSKWYKSLNKSEKDKFRKYLKDEYYPAIRKQEKLKVERDLKSLEKRK